MSRVAVLALLICLPAAANACPRPAQYYYPPCSVVVYRPCPPPAFAYYCQPAAPAVRDAVAKPAEKVPGKEDNDDRSCHITGRVVFDGDPIPVQKEIRNSNGAYTEDWVVNPDNRGVKSVVVWLAPEPTEEEWDRLKSRGPKRLREFPTFRKKDVHPSLPKRQDATLLILEAPIAFIPHVVAVRAGSDIFILNVSTRFETAKWESGENGEGIEVMNPLGGALRMEGVQPERFPLKISSANHQWMKAWVRVFNHPYFAVTNADGQFEIRFAPKGKLRLFVWQEDVGFRTGPEGRFGEAIEAPSGRLDLGELKFKLSK